MSSRATWTTWSCDWASWTASSSASQPLRCICLSKPRCFVWTHARRSGWVPCAVVVQGQTLVHNETQLRRNKVRTLVLWQHCNRTAQMQPVLCVRVASVRDGRLPGQFYRERPKFWQIPTVIWRVSVLKSFLSPKSQARVGCCGAAQSRAFQAVRCGTPARPASGRRGHAGELPASSLFSLALTSHALPRSPRSLPSLTLSSLSCLSARSAPALPPALSLSLTVSPPLFD
jgi:hypothetical protein